MVFDDPLCAHHMRTVFACWSRRPAGIYSRRTYHPALNSSTQSRTLTHPANNEYVFWCVIQGCRVCRTAYVEAVRVLFDVSAKYRLTFHHATCHRNGIAIVYLSPCLSARLRWSERAVANHHGCAAKSVWADGRIVGGEFSLYAHHKHTLARRPQAHDKRWAPKMCHIFIALCSGFRPNKSTHIYTKIAL